MYDTTVSVKSTSLFEHIATLAVPGHELEYKFGLSPPVHLVLFFY